MTDISARIKRFRTAAGLEILAGQDDASNDYLTCRLARPEDFWFHVAGFPGSHVVLRTNPGEEPGRDCIREAAAVAAWFSKMREGGMVPVSYCLARNVRKEKNFKAGTVRIGKEKKIKVRPALPAGEP